MMLRSPRRQRHNSPVYWLRVKLYDLFHYSALGLTALLSVQVALGLVPGVTRAPEARQSSVGCREVDDADYDDCMREAVAQQSALVQEAIYGMEGAHYYQLAVDNADQAALDRATSNAKPYFELTEQTPEQKEAALDEIKAQIAAYLTEPDYESYLKLVGDLSFYKQVENEELQQLVKQVAAHMIDHLQHKVIPAVSDSASKVDLYYLLARYYEVMNNFQGMVDTINAGIKLCNKFGLSISEKIYQHLLDLQQVAIAALNAQGGNYAFAANGEAVGQPARSWGGFVMSLFGNGANATENTTQQDFIPGRGLVM